VVFFKIFQKKTLVVMLRMDEQGQYTPLTSAGKPLAEMWPRWAAVEPYFSLWIGERLGHPFPPSRGRAEIAPGSLAYPRALADALTHDPLLHLWACVAPVEMFISLHQLAGALGKTVTPQFHDEVAQRGLPVHTNPAGHYQVSLGQALRVYGAEVVDRVLLRTGQAADFLGVTPGSARIILHRLHLPLEREGDLLVAWGRLRQVRRTGPRVFEIAEKGENDA
jgi:hypothetical protein